MNRRVAVTVGDEDFSVGCDGCIGRVVEGSLQARCVALAQRADLFALGVENQDLVGISVDQKDSVVARDEDPVRIGNPPVSPSLEKIARGREDQYRRIAALV